MADRYSKFADLAAKETIGTDYRILLEDRGTRIAVIAPHGGCIEPGTSEIAKGIAGEDLTIYVFEGLGRRAHRDLHIASHRFDEPQGMQIVTAAEAAVPIHGRRDGDDAQSVSLGGRNRELRDAISSSLRRAGFRVAPADHGLAGLDSANICNRASSGGGVQLEIPRSLRDQLVEDGTKMRAFTGAVREAISKQAKVDSGSSLG